MSELSELDEAVVACSEIICDEGKQNISDMIEVILEYMRPLIKKRDDDITELKEELEEFKLFGAGTGHWMVIKGHARLIHTSLDRKEGEAYEIAGKLEAAKDEIEMLERLNKMEKASAEMWRLNVEALIQELKHQEKKYDVAPKDAKRFKLLERLVPHLTCEVEYLINIQKDEEGSNDGEGVWSVWVEDGMDIKLLGQGDSLADAVDATEAAHAAAGTTRPPEDRCESCGALRDKSGYCDCN